MDILIRTPFSNDELEGLKAGDNVLLSGVVYTARDAAHARMIESINKGMELPFDIRGQAIYYLGPTKAGDNKIIGSAGPTTSYRMDSYTPQLLDLGLKAMIGKGMRSKEVINSMINNKCVYFAAIGGIGALMSKSIVQSDVIDYEDLGTEAIRKLIVKNMALIVAIDCYGNNLYEIGPKEYLRSIEK